MAENEQQANQTTEKRPNGGGGGGGERRGPGGGPSGGPGAEAVVKVEGRAGIEEIAETGEAIVAATEVAIGVVTGALRVHQRSTSRS